MNETCMNTPTRLDSLAGCALREHLPLHRRMSIVDRRSGVILAWSILLASRVLVA